MDKQSKLVEYEEKFSWHEYNKSQTKEKIFFLRLLKDLCSILPEKQMIITKKPIRLQNVIFCICMKAYCLKSARRLIGELELCKQSGMIEKVPHFNSILNYLRNPRLTPILQDLIVLSSLPMVPIEKKFACDATGFGMSVLNERWSQIRQQYSKHHKYLKAHITYGVLSNIVTSCRITEGTGADSPMLKEMVDETAQNFQLYEWSADKAYLSKLNLKIIYDYGCVPFIPFKQNNVKNSRGSMIWTEMYTFFQENRELFMKKYHLRSNAESGMQMIKSRFGDITNMTSDIGATNDVLVRILCHNLCVLIQEAFLLGMDINFAQFKDKAAQIQI